MPSYPCEACGAPVEITGHEYDLRCKKCGDQRPFKCSKCQRRIGIDSVYHPERLTFRKPLFCQECGAEVDFVECRQCKTSLMRSNGVEITVGGESRIYHRECYQSAQSMKIRVFAIAAVALFFIVGYLGYMMGYLTGLPGVPWVVAFMGSMLGIYFGYKIGALFGPK